MSRKSTEQANLLSDPEALSAVKAPPGHVRKPSGFRGTGKLMVTALLHKQATDDTHSETFPSLSFSSQ